MGSLDGLFISTAYIYFPAEDSAIGHMFPYHRRPVKGQWPELWDVPEPNSSLCEHEVANALVVGRARRPVLVHIGPLVMAWSSLAQDVTRRNGIASILALTTSSLLIALALLMDPYLMPAPPTLPPFRAALLDGDEYLFTAASEPGVKMVATFNKTAREANGIALWNVTFRDPVGDRPGYEGVAIFRHDRIAWRFMIELWLRPRPFHLVTDRLDDQRICRGSSCFYVFRSDRHRLIPMAYAHLYSPTR